jgi:hypothetical protein
MCLLFPVKVQRTDTVKVRVPPAKMKLDGTSVPVSSDSFGNCKLESILMANIKILPTNLNVGGSFIVSSNVQKFYISNHKSPVVNCFYGRYQRWMYNQPAMGDSVPFIVD